MIQDLPYILYWWFVIFALGILVFPLTKRLFSKFFDFGYPFTKVLAILLVSYLTWLLGSLKILPFFQETIFLVIIVLALVNFLIFRKNSSNNKKFLPKKGAAAFKIGRIIIFEEILFFLALLFWSWIRAHEPSIHGLEKFMDYGFINSILKSKFFPPHDIWLSPSSDPRYTGGFTINYYYFGHLTAAVLTKLSGIDSAITYNLVLANIFALCFTGAFSIGANLIYLFLNKAEEIPKRRAMFVSNCSENLRASKLLKFLDRLRKFSKSEAEGDEQKTTKSRPSVRFETRHVSLKTLIFAGLLTAFLVTLAGNLHTLHVFKDPSRYWYPDATRFIPFTIHEFPLYSWVVADLHGHVFDIPFVLLTIAILLSLIINYKLLIIPLLGLILAVLYMTNAWDGLIYLALSGLVILAARLKFGKQTDQLSKAQSAKRKAQNYNLKPKTTISFKLAALVFTFTLLAFSFFLFSLPFNLNFHPFVKGIGVNCPPSFLPDKWGPFLFEKGNCQRSPLYMLAILWGFFFFNAISFIIYLLKNSKFEARSSKQALNTKFKVLNKGLSSLKFRIWSASWRIGFRILGKVDVFILLMILLSTLLLIFPEFFYAKDIYPGHFRANTMFKLGYQAFIMMSIASGYIIIRIINSKHEARNSKQITNSNAPMFKTFGILNLKNWNLLRISKLVFRILLIPQLFLISIYPYYAIVSYYGSLKNYQGLDGIAWLKNQYPDDYQAITWLKRYTLQAFNPSSGRGFTSYTPVILEAVGESYTDYARVSAHTGLPTILGWPVHEWLWRGSYDEPGARIPEVQTIYESQDLEETKKMLEKYNVSYVFLGSLEREKYKNLNEEKFNQLGKAVFESGETKIFEIN